MDQMKNYEGMFLFDAGKNDSGSAAECIRAILERSGCEILAVKHWDERRLAYDIQGCKRGLYMLTYFKADPLKVGEIERDCKLEERVLRLLLLSRETLTQEQISAETPATSASLRVAERTYEEGPSDRYERRTYARAALDEIPEDSNEAATDDTPA